MIKQMSGPGFRANRRQALQLLAAGMGAFTLPATRGFAADKGAVIWAANSGECDPADIARFKQETGIAVDYREVISDADQFFASVKPQFAAGLQIGYDLLCISSAYVSVYADSGWLQPLDHARLPNVGKNLLPNLAKVAHADIAIPYDFAPVGLAFNRQQFPDGVESWGQLLDPAVHGKVGLYATPIVNVSAWGLYLKQQGKIDHVPAEMTIDEAMAVLGFLEPHIKSGQLLSSQGENAGQKLSNGDLIASMAPPVNISQLDPNKVGFVVPKEGAPAYVDRLGIPKGAANPDGALALIDWWFQAKNAASFSRYTLQYPYAAGVQEELAKSDPALAANKLIFPPADVLDRLYPYPAPWTLAERARIARKWTEITSG